MKTTRILAFHGTPFSAGAFYRGFGPLYAMQKEYPVEILKPASRHALSWEDLYMADLVYLRAPHSPAMAEAMRQCQILGIPTWADFDDDHEAVPEHSPQYKLYTDADNLSAYRYCLANADLVTVSTPYLATKLHRKACVVANALPDSWFLQPILNRPPVGSPVKILFRGSPYHSMAMSKYKPIIEELLATLNVHVTFFGAMPDGGFEGTNVQFVPWTNNLTAYFEHIRTAGYSYFATIWDDTEFSRSKSNIAFLEAIHAGAAMIAPPFPVFTETPAFEHQNEPFGHKLAQWHTLHAASVANSRHYIGRFQSLSLANNLRFRLITHLLQGKQQLTHSI